RHEREVLNAIAAPVDEHGEPGDITAILLGGTQFHARSDEAERIVCLAPTIESPDRVGSYQADQLAVLGRPVRALLPCTPIAKMAGGSGLQPAKLVADRFALSEQEQRPNMILALETEVGQPIHPAAGVNVALRPE